jgi:hypothetical protein
MNAINEKDDSVDLEGMQSAYARALYILRETRKTLLRQYGVEDEAALLEKIRSGEIQEHPGYDHYLSAQIVEQARVQLRAEIVAQIDGALAADVPEHSLHMMLKDRIEAAYANKLTEPVRMAQDALLLSFDSGLMMEVRYAGVNEYALRWSWGDAEFCIDTAPVHGDCSTAPNHLHRDDGSVAADTLTSIGTDCWTNFSRLLDTLLTDPLLQNASAS